ncbi:OLC1v1017767C1 [Oldenlandia corymbosa var. corymbosa]|uniref:OLC1v1017767C1 n=1 Tax=Oldenlandia corymbosa var. corymbosa TaxID=529605 RepID=A0AAV1EAG6_OLDCO|nr:OLC1v1017767C1 [Oldenlandia corymbosa var. corymbosa]
MDPKTTYSCVDDSRLLINHSMLDDNIPPLKKKTRYSSSLVAYDYDNIPADIILNILMELPAKSLLRFRCVSKDWRCIIEDPHFVYMYGLRSRHRRGGLKFLAMQNKKRSRKRGNHQNDQHFLLVDQEGNKTEVPHPMDGQTLTYDSYSQAGVEGIICLDNMIWNPTIRKKFDLPPQCPNMSFIRSGSNEPEIENIYYLGFDSPTQQYKVLSICVGCPKESELGNRYSQGGLFLQGMFQMQVITIEGTKSSWRDITHHIPEKEMKDMTLIGYSTNLYLKDEIYIVVGYPEHLALMVFSVGQETFRFIHLPEEITHAESKFWNLIEVRECVALIKMNNDEIADATGTEIWRLINTNTSSIHNNAPAAKEDWEKIIYSTWPIYLYHPKISNPELEREPVVLCAINSTQNLVETLDETATKFYYSYWDITQGNMKKARKLQKILGYYSIISKHVETLFDPTSPKSWAKV